MRKTIGSFVIAIAVSGVTCALSTAAFGAPNQGDTSKLTTVTNAAVSCESPVAAPKVEGSMGTTISVLSTDPISFVTIKSGNGAVLVSSTFGATGATITMSKDVSNYIVWTCASGNQGPEA
jgi:hypothetical protein